MAGLILIVVSIFGEQAAFNNLNTFQKSLVRAEIIDMSECPYLFSKSENFGQNLYFLIVRINELRGTPNMCWVPLWPHYAVIRARLDLNIGYGAELKRGIALYEGSPKGEILKLALEDNSFLYKVWDAAGYVSNKYLPVSSKRIALGKLKSLLDEIDKSWFYSGTLPEVVPMWSYSRVER